MLPLRHALGSWFVSIKGRFLSTVVMNTNRWITLINQKTWSISPARALFIPSASPAPSLTGLINDESRSAMAEVHWQARVTPAAARSQRFNTVRRINTLKWSAAAGWRKPSRVEASSRRPRVCKWFVNSWNRRMNCFFKSAPFSLLFALEPRYRQQVCSRETSFLDGV